jgi:hypothetical protein
VVLDRLGAHEQLRGGIAVGCAGGHQLRDSQLLRGQVVERAHVALAGLLAGGVELGAGPLGPERVAEPLEGVERRAQLGARLDLAARTPQALAVGELRAGALECRRVAGVLANGLLEELLGLLRIIGQHRPAAHEQALDERGIADGRPCLEAPERSPGTLRLADA